MQIQHRQLANIGLCIMLASVMLSTSSCSTVKGWVGIKDPSELELIYWKARAGWVSVNEAWNIMLAHDNSRVEAGEKPWFKQDDRDKAFKIVTQALVVFEKIEPYVTPEPSEDERAAVLAGIEEVNRLGQELKSIYEGV